MAPDFTIIRRFVAWFSIAVLGVASWLPAEEMIRTGADGRLEHRAAYLISGLAVFTAYPRRLKWLIAILMTFYAGILEFGQLWVPGRHAAILDWAASCARSCCMTHINEFMRRKARKNMLKLRLIGIRDYSVLEGEQRIGRIRFAGERMPGVWLWNVVVPLTGGLPMGSARDLDAAKAEFGGLGQP
jgi:VanZ family protein